MRLCAPWRGHGVATEDGVLYPDLKGEVPKPRPELSRTPQRPFERRAQLPDHSAVEQVSECSLLKWVGELRGEPNPLLKLALAQVIPSSRTAGQETR
jgi:hypothetical protein